MRGPPGSSVHGILQARILEWVAMPSSRGSSRPRGEPRCPASQVGSLLSEPPGRPRNTREGSLLLLQRIFPIQELNQGLLHCRWIFYQLSYQGSPGRVTIGDYRFLYLRGWKCLSLDTEHNKAANRPSLL